MHPAQNLEQALPLLQCPGCRQGALAVATGDATGDLAVRCGECWRSFPYRAGILDMLGEGEQQLTPAQKTMQDGALVLGYTLIREPLTLLSGGYTFRHELRQLEQTLDLQPGDTVLDVACGHGNFTAAIAERVAPGLVLGVDISRPMLERAAGRMTGEDNVLLVRGDVFNLPFRTDAIAKVNCSAGFCQFPDVDAAVENIHRVLAPGGLFAGSCFASSSAFLDKRAQRVIGSVYGMRFVDLVALGAKMGNAGFGAYTSTRDRWFGYFSAVKRDEQGAEP